MARRVDASRFKRPTYERLEEEPEPLRGPKAPLYEIGLSLFLFVAGVFFLLMGASTFWKASLSESLPLTMLGLICFLPGAYHAFIIFNVWIGTPGFSYDMIPSEERER